MPTFNSYQLAQSKITAIAVDTNNGNYVWIAYEQKNTFCLNQKVSAINPKSVYYSISLPVTSINSMCVSGVNLFVAVTDSVKSGYMISVVSPLSSQTVILKSAINGDSSPIAVVASSNYVYFLTQGTSTTSQISYFTNLGVWQQTINLSKYTIAVHNSVSFTVDANENLWIVNNTNPTNLFRVWFQSGGLWDIQQTILS